MIRRSTLTPSPTPTLSKGYTIAELAIVIAIIGIILGISLYTYYSARKTSAINTLADNILFALETAKSTAMSGQAGKSYGVKFNANSYVSFAGTTYDPADPSDRTVTISDGYQITTTLSSADASVVFTRITGVPSATGTTTVSEIADPTQVRYIYVGGQGDISMIK